MQRTALLRCAGSASIFSEIWRREVRELGRSPGLCRILGTDLQQDVLRVLCSHAAGLQEGEPTLRGCSEAHNQFSGLIRTRQNSNVCAEACGALQQREPAKEKCNPT